ncbi:Uncharacterised protein [Haemophilus parahaemolyticus]|uniref:Uncharacterized protein n=1 Tax=Haemophilus parahaemolyticus TaxID=735 RepID=A0A377I188_HAEPH|nr:hypothetical protein [Haemophilus parahaemolyticus]STO64303.1 Uncharacterised protein [Haemophilus parahaemolyticus]
MTTSQSEATQEKTNLPERERERIKQAILNSVARNTNYPPDELAKLTCDVICLIDSYKY